MQRERLDLLISDASLRHMSRIHQLCLDAIQPIPIIKLVGRLARLKVAQVLPLVSLILHTVMFSSPYPQFHLIVRVVRRCVEDFYIPTLRLRANVALLQVSVYKTRFDASALRLQRAKQPGYDKA